MVNFFLLQIDDSEKRNPVLDFPESLLIEDDQPVAMVTGGEDEEGAISDPGSEMMEENSDKVKVARNTDICVSSVWSCVQWCFCAASGSFVVVPPCGSLP